MCLQVCPQTVAEWYQQRQRWVAGNTQLLAYKLPKATQLHFEAAMVYVAANCSVITVISHSGLPSAIII